MQSTARIGPGTEKAKSQPCRAVIGICERVKQMDYDGTVYIGVVGGDHEISECRDSILRIQTRAGDGAPVIQRGTKGYENREAHIRRFLASDHDFIFLMDADQVFPEDALERLRSHRLSFVSGYYMRRQINPIAPVWFEPFDGDWPLTPWVSDPERGRLHELGASGWGCMLVHRVVFESVATELKGEGFVLEDDMDMYPYDLQRIMAAIRGVEAVALGVVGLEQLLSHAQVLRQEIRPLRVIKSQVGSDIRFPFYARRAGFRLWGDPDVRCGHALQYFVSPDDYSSNADDSYRANLLEYLTQGSQAERECIQQQLAEATR